MILTSLPACEYHTNAPENLKSDFVKVLKTDSWQEKILRKECSFLETPNVISGVAASGDVLFLLLNLLLIYTRNILTTTHSLNTYILLDLLMFSVTAYF